MAKRSHTGQSYTTRSTRRKQQDAETQILAEAASNARIIRDAHLILPDELKTEIRLIGSLISACRSLDHAEQILECCKFIFHETRCLDFWFVKAVEIAGRTLDIGKWNSSQKANFRCFRRLLDIENVLGQFMRPPSYKLYNNWMNK